jgi:hypothetical protein
MSPRSIRRPECPRSPGARRSAVSVRDAGLGSWSEVGVWVWLRDCLVLGCRVRLGYVVT